VCLRSMTTIMHSLEEDGSSSEADASDADPMADSRQQSDASQPKAVGAMAAAAAGNAARNAPGNGPTPYAGPHESPQLQVVCSSVHICRSGTVLHIALLLTAAVQ
jgi:hypothetical protein